MVLALAFSFALTAASARAVVADWDRPRVERLLANVTGTRDGQCAACHAAAPASIKRWAAAAQDSFRCLDDEQAAPQKVLRCLQTATTPPRYSTSKLGFLTAGLHTQAFGTWFRRAYPNPAEAASAQAAMVAEAGMPAGAEPWSEADYQELEAWLRAGMPLLDAILTPDPPQPCVAEVTPALRSHVAAMSANGWAAKHREAALPMFGCKDAGECLQDFPDLSRALGLAEVPQTIRRLIDLPRSSQWWVRSSPDGRYVGFGGRPSAILDLEAVRTGRGAREIVVDAPYDPAFLADNRSFSFAGTRRGITVCKQSLLTKLQSAPNPSVTMWEPECTPVGDGTYQSFGASLEGDRFIVTTGTYVSDFGGNGNEGSSFARSATLDFNLYSSDGLGFQPNGSAHVYLPFRTEPVLSPSGQAVVSRFGANSDQSGYEVNVLDAQAAPGLAHARLTKGAQICALGAKASFSFDERFLVTHRYAGSPPTSSNLVLIDLLSGATTELTKMPEGSFALFPHFRADGWIYFLVKEGGDGGREYVAATNAARLR